MSELLLPTKLFIPPQRPMLVPRLRLVEYLNQGIRSKLILMAAPAGFGKTTLVTTWLAQRAGSGDRRPAAWLSLDENDNIFPRFFSYFIAASQTVYPDLAQGLLSSLRMSPLPDEEAILSALVHEMATLDQPLLLVLDDYHLITDEAIHKALGRLIDTMPPNLQLVITSREDPPLPLPRWRARDQLTELRASDLRFTMDEAAAFLGRTMGLQLDESAVTMLEERTEGWIAGLQLAALSLRRAADTQGFIDGFSGSNRRVADYLLEEVLYHQPPWVQAFLLQTSILERFCAELCDFVLQSVDREITAGEEAIQTPAPNSNALEIIEHLDNANLFLISLDGRRRWYRYHHLFAQLLQDRLSREQGQASVNRIHQQASRWFLIQGLLEEAIHHAIQGHDFAEAARLMATYPSDSLWDQGSTSLFKRWGQLIPLDFLLGQPKSLISIAAAYLVTGEFHGFKKYMALCEGIESIHGEYALLKSTLVRNEGDFSQAIHLAQEAGEFLPEDETMLRAVALVQIANNLERLGALDRAEKIIIQARLLMERARVTSPNMHLQVIQMQAAAAILRADPYQAQRYLRDGLALAERTTPGPPPMVGMMYAGLGQLHYEWNELAEAGAAYGQARAWADSTGISDIHIAALVGETELLCQQRRLSAMEASFEIFRDFTRQGRLQDMIDQVESMIATYNLRSGRLGEAVRWANSSGFNLADRPDSPQRFYYQVWVAIRLAEYRSSGSRKNLPQLLTLLDYLFQEARAGHYQRDMIELLILQTLVLDYRGDGAAAGQALQQALELAQPGNLVRVFLDSDPALVSLLAKKEEPFPRRLVQAYHQEQRERGDEKGSLPFDLTPRELEILLEIVAGLSNKEIEEKLVISHNTVRSHIKNLYSKLAVNSRTQAIKKVRELGLF